MSINIPLSKSHVLLPDDPGDSARHATEALTAWHAGNIDQATCRTQLNALAATLPDLSLYLGGAGDTRLARRCDRCLCLLPRRLSPWLDRARGQAGTAHSTSLGSTKAIVGSCNVYTALRAATAIGETTEAARTRDFLLDLDPTNHFELRRD